MDRRGYPYDVSDAEWRWIQPVLSGERPCGRHRSVNAREVVNAILYVLDTGCS